MTLETLPIPESPFYVTGGTLPADAASYVARQADSDLLNSLLSGEYCYILNSRQMGKSSLCVRTIARLKAQGVTTIFLDLTKFGGGNLTAEQWYAGMLSEFGRACGMRSECLAYWKENASLSPLQRFFGAIQEVALPHLEGRLVFFVDEIDVTRSLPFSTDEFFAAIRQCYVGRATQPLLERLVFCLLGTATPADLIQDTRVSPFNIGKRIELRDFTPEEAAPLAQGLGRNGSTLLERVLYWTGGHPYLTQRLCRSVAESGVQTVSEVDRLCTELFLTHTAKESDDNLAFVRNRLLKSEVDLAALLDLYRKMRDGKRPAYDETNPLCPVLRLSGVAKVREGMLLVRNRIYGHVFDREWVETHMPDAEKRRQRQAYRAGVVRASLVAGGVALAMSLLAIFAFTQRSEARHSAKIAQGQTRLAQQQTALATANAQLARTNAEKEFKAHKEADNQRQVAVDAQQRASQNLQLANERLEAVTKAQNATEAEKKRAKTETQNALEAKATADHLLYRADMNVAQQMYRDANAMITVELLYRHWNDPDRDFEWEYLYHLCHLELFSLKGHVDWVISVAFSPDGKRIVTGSFDTTAIVWDATTGKELFPLKGHGGGVYSVAFSSDGKRIATGSWDMTTKVWNADNGKELLSLKGHVGRVMSVAFSPDGKHIVTGSLDRIAIVWDATTGKALFSLKGHGGGVDAVAFSPDGKRIATSSQDKTTKVWDAGNGKELYSLQGHTNDVTCVAFSPDGKHIVTGSEDNTTIVWDAVTRKVLFPLKGHTSSVRAIAFSSDGKRIATGSTDNTAKIWDAQTGKELLTLTGHLKRVSSVTFSPDGERLVTGSYDGSARVWSTATIRQSSILTGHEGAVNSVALSSDGKRIVTGSLDKTAIVWDAATGKVLFPLQGHTSSVQSVAFSSDGKRIATGSLDKTAIVWDATTGNKLLTLTGHTGGLTSVAFSPDGKRIVTGSLDKTAIVWDAVTGKVLFSLRWHTYGIYSVAFSSDGKRIVTGGDDNIVRVWDAVTGIGLFSLSGHQQLVSSVAFSPDGERLVTGSHDGSARVWNVTTGQEILTLNRNSSPVNSVAFSSDGKRIVTGSNDDMVRVWDAQTGSELLSLSGHTGSISSVAFSQDKKRILTGSADGTARVWEAWHGLMQPTARLDAETQLAQNYEQERKWSKLIAILSEMIQNNPGQLSYRLRRGQAYALLYQLPQALADYKQCTSIYNDILQWQTLALLYFADGDQTNYRRTCERIVQKYGGEPQYLWRIGFICHHSPQALRDYKPLLTLVRKQIKQNSNNEILKLTLGMLLYRAGEYRESVGTLTSVLNQSSPWPDAWMYLAMAHYRLGNRAEARRIMARAESVLLYSPPPTTGWYTLLLYRTHLREAEAMIGKGDPALLRQYRQHDALIAKAQGYEGAQQWTEAASVLSELIRLYPENVEYYIRRGTAYMKTKKLPEALADFKHRLIPALPPDNLPKSQNSLKTDVLFYNDTASPVKLYWIGFDGKPVGYGTIPPHAPYLENGTFVTHVWLITNIEDKPLAGYIVPPMGGLALIEAK